MIVTVSIFINGKTVAKRISVSEDIPYDEQIFVIGKLFEVMKKEIVDMIEER